MTNQLRPPTIDEQVLDIRDQLLSIQSTLHDLRLDSQATQRTKIIDFNMPFLALIGILIKIALASIPAIIILAVLFSFIGFVVAALLAGTVALAPILAPAPASIASTPRSSTVRPTATIAPVTAPLVGVDLALTAIDSETVGDTQTVTGILTNRSADPSPALSAVVEFQHPGRSPVQQRANIQPIPPGQTVAFTVTNTLPGDWTYIVRLEDYIGRAVQYRDLAP